MNFRTARVFQSASAATVLCLIALLTVKKPSGNVQAYLQEPAMPLKLMFTADNLDAATYQLYESVRSNINGDVNIPIARTNYYSTVNNVNGYNLNGWGGIITSIQPNAHGYLVSIDVQPELFGQGRLCHYCGQRILGNISGLCGWHFCLSEFA